MGIRDCRAWLLYEDSDFERVIEVKTWEGISGYCWERCMAKNLVLVVEGLKRWGDREMKIGTIQSEGTEYAWGKMEKCLPQQRGSTVCGLSSSFDKRRQQMCLDDENQFSLERAILFSNTDRIGVFRIDMTLRHNIGSPCCWSGN